MRLRWFLLPGLVPVLILAGCGSVQSSDPDGGGGTGGDADPAQVVLRYDFDDGLLDNGGARYAPDLGGADRRGVVLGANGGEGLLEVIARDDGAGSAIRFPGECADPDPAACPRVILEAKDSAEQNPGERDFAVTLDFLVPSLPVGSAIGDQNVMQKGNFDDPAQWKVEIDSDRRAGCIFHHPDDGGTPTIIRIQRAVDDGDWHRLRCERRASLLTVRLDGGDGTDTRSVEIAAGTSVDIANAQPIRIGGQNVLPSADQFHGSLDNIAVEIF
jgi:hypothetical protein